MYEKLVAEVQELLQDPSHWSIVGPDKLMYAGKVLELKKDTSWTLDGVEFKVVPSPLYMAFLRCYKDVQFLEREEKSRRLLDSLTPDA